MAGHEDALRKLTVNDESAMENELGLRMALSPEHPLDLKTGALVRLSALVAIGAAPPSFQWAGAAAVRSGATPDEVVSMLCAIAPIVGLARVVAAAPEIALAIGYDTDVALETLVGDAQPPGSWAPVR